MDKGIRLFDGKTTSPVAPKIALRAPLRWVEDRLVTLEVGGWQDGVASLLFPFEGGVCLTMRTGDVLLTGSVDPTDETQFFRAQVWSPKTQKSTEVGATRCARFQAGTAILPDGKVLIAGGFDLMMPAFTPSRMVEIYNPATKLCTSAFRSRRDPIMIPAGGGAVTVPIPVPADALGAALVFFGASPNTDIHVLNPYLPIGENFGATFAPGAIFAQVLDGGAVGPGEFSINTATGVLTFNGPADGDKTVSVSYIYKTDVVDADHPSPMARTRGGSPIVMTLPTTGQVLAATGFTGDNVFAAVIAVSAELYTPAAGTWAATGDMAFPQGNDPAAYWLLPNGNVMIAGGVDGNPFGPPPTILDISQVYDVAGGIWLVGPALNIPRFRHTIALLPNGQVAILGGSTDFVSSVATAEIYDPLLDLFLLAGDMVTARSGAQAAVLPDLQVLVSGGHPAAEYGDNPVVIQGQEVFDLLSRAFSGIAPTTQKTRGLLARLPSGAVGMFGGDESTEDVGSTNATVMHPLGA